MICIIPWVCIVTHIISQAIHIIAPLIAVVQNVRIMPEITVDWVFHRIGCSRVVFVLAKQLVVKCINNLGISVVQVSTSFRGLRIQIL